MDIVAVSLKTLSLLPLIILGMIPLVLILAYFAEWSIGRSMKKAANTPCPKCGNPVGLVALRRARSEAKGSSSKEDQKGTRLLLRRRFIARWIFSCDHCGTLLELKHQDWTLSIVGESLV